MPKKSRPHNFFEVDRKTKKKRGTFKRQLEKVRASGSYKTIHGVITWVPK